MLYLLTIIRCTVCRLRYCDIRIDRCAGTAKRFRRQLIVPVVSPRYVRLNQGLISGDTFGVLSENRGSKDSG